MHETIISIEDNDSDEEADSEDGEISPENWFFKKEFSPILNLYQILEIEKCMIPFTTFTNFHSAINLKERFFL